MKISLKQYAHILDKALAEAGAEGQEQILKAFAKELEKEGKISRLGEIIEHWKPLYNKRHGLLDVTVETTDKEHAKFPHSFAGKKVALTVKENPNLLGGSVVKIGDYVIDASIKTKLNAIRN